MSQRMTSFKGVCQPAVINSSLVLREAWKLSPTPSRLLFDVLPSGLYEENEKICHSSNFSFFFFWVRQGAGLLVFWVTLKGKVNISCEFSLEVI